MTEQTTQPTLDQIRDQLEKISNFAESLTTIIAATDEQTARIQDLYPFALHISENLEKIVEHLYKVCGNTCENETK